MASIPEKRKIFMSYLCKVMNLLDPSGDNAKIYRNMLDPMSDIEFDKWVRKFFADEKANFYLEIVEYTRDLKMVNIKKCAEFMKVPLFERVALPYVTGDKTVMNVTPEPVAVGYIHEKRMQQTLLKKSGGSIEIQKRNPRTGQVTGEDKNARNSDVETFSLVALGANYALKELMGPRADDRKMAAEFYNKISKDGYVSIDEIPSDPKNKTALNSMDIYFAMQGVRTNLVGSMDRLPGLDN